ncbi:MAG: 16S rRNA (uracil(1498)-N(3))-methyltransferase, partial [Casimicrobiaceae bacterium]|nr:16S rRNA (uracil(1498)-N(3))-methyltransferase [Casimicrobiaceae bacterium]
MAQPPRFFCPPPIPEDAHRWPLPEAAAQHTRVLRLRVGDAVTLFDGLGGELPATLIAVDRRAVWVGTGTRRPIERERARQITLAVGLIASERFDWLVQKAVELGVARIEPLLTERSQRIPGSIDKRLAHWQGIVIAASEQCGRNRLAHIEPPQPLAVWLERLGDRSLVLADGEGGTSYISPEGPLTLAVGPEGGFSPGELAALRARAQVRLTLGPTVLRAETAAVAGLAL